MLSAEASPDVTKEGPSRAKALCDCSVPSNHLWFLTSTAPFLSMPKRSPEVGWINFKIRSLTSAEKCDGNFIVDPSQLAIILYVYL